MIEVKNVSMLFPIAKSYKHIFKKTYYHTSLKEIDLKINHGDRVGFLGVNGAGKTTLLKLIGGLLYPSVGSIVVNGHDNVLENLKARREVGYVLNEERSFYWRLTGVQNLEFFGLLDNLNGNMLRKRIEELICLVGLENAGSKLVATYSSGMKQRLAIARGLLCNPKILILDEPTRTLDPEAIEDIKALISKRIHDNTERTLLIATHRFDEVEELCNKLCVMKEGRLLAFNSVDNIKKNFRSISEYYYSIIAEKELVEIV